MSEQGNSVTPTQSETQALVKPSSKSKKSWVRRGLTVFIAVFVVLFLFLLTGKGQRTAIQWLDKGLDNLTIEQVEGSLQDGLRLKNTRFVSDGVEVNAGNLVLDLGFECLLDRRACLDQVSLESIQVAIDTTKLPPSEKKESPPFTGLNLPLGAEIKQLNLKNIQVKVDALDIKLKQLSTGALAQGNHIDLANTDIDGITLSLPPRSEPPQQAVKKQEKSAKTVDWEALKTQLSQPLLAGNQSIHLPLSFTIEHFRLTDVAITQKVLNQSAEKPIVHIKQADVQGEVTEKQWQLKQLSVLSDRGEIAGEGTLTLAESYPLMAKLRINMPEWKEIALPASNATLNLAGNLLDKTTLNLTTTGVANAALTGAVQLAKSKMPFELRLTGDNAAYAFNSNLPPLTLQKTDIKLSGDLLDYQLAGSAQVSGMHIPKTEVVATGKGGLTYFDAKEIALKGLGGNANVAGKVSWEKGVDWDSKAAVKQLNLGELLPDWAAQISGSFESKGYAAKNDMPQSWHVALNKVDLQGSLYQKALSLTGDATLNAKNLLDTPQLVLKYGENSLLVKGLLGEDSRLNAEIKAPNLHGLVPKLNATLNGHLILTGKLSQPNVELDLMGKNLAYDQYKIQSLVAKGKVVSDKQIQGNVDLSLTQFHYGDVKLNDARLTLKGSEANHQLSLTSSGLPVAADLQISGNFDRLQQQWKGNLSQATILTEQFGRFQASKGIAVQYAHNKQSANIAGHCWQHSSVKLCFPSSFNVGSEGKVPVELSHFDLAMLKPLLPKESQLSGVIDGKGEVAWAKGKALSAKVDLQSHHLAFTQQLEAGRVLPLVFSSVKVNANLADNQLGLKSAWQLENDGRLQTDIRISDIAKSRQLSGTINLQQLSLKMAQHFLSKGDQIAGNIDSNLTLAGNITSPLLKGRLDLKHLNAKATIMPFDIIDGQLALLFNGASSTLTGRVKTPESELRLEGDADWHNLSAWRSHIRAQANKFRLDIPNMAKIDVSPNVSVTVTPKALTLAGDIEIPWARIEVEELPDSAVTVSSDEVIMEGQTKKKRKLSDPLVFPSTPKNAMAMNADIKIRIGDDVRLNAYGLKTNLKGLMNVSQGKNGLGLYGNVNLERGRYAAFGQDLLIRKGVIQFNGLPSQPTLNVEAIRNPEAMEDPTIKAGVKVTGLADSPEVKVFSEPSMSQNQALSYVLTGRSLENSGDGSSSNAMAAALLSLSLAKSSKMVGAVGSTFGLKDLSVSTAGIGDNTKVEVSASLAPKFRVKYGVGIFAPLTELTLRYNLAPKLYLQWLSSINQAINLVYRFEFD